MSANHRLKAEPNPSIPLLPYDPNAPWRAAEIEWYRAMTPAERLQLTFWMNECSRVLAVDPIRRRHPDYSAEEVVKALVVRRHGRALAEQVWPNWTIPEP